MVERDGPHAPPDVCSDAALGLVRPAARPYRAPTLTVYGTIRDLTRGPGSIGKPDSPASHSHSMVSPWASGGNPGYR